MTKYEFLGDLSRLLSNLPEDERKQAMKYYEDYFADAGEAREQDVLQELGTPKEVAKLILEESSDNIQYGNDAFTHAENVVKPYSTTNDSHKENKGNWQSSYSTQNNYDGQSSSNAENNNTWQNASQAQAGSTDNTQQAKKNPERDTTKTVLLIVIIIVTSPIWISIVTGIFSFLIGIASAILGVFSALILGGGGVALGGVASAVGGIIAMITGEVAAGTLTTGIGCILFSVGGLLCYLGIMLCIKFFPVAYQGIVKGFRWCSARLNEIFH